MTERTGDSGRNRLVMSQDIGDSPLVFGGDTSGRVGSCGCRRMSLLILVSVLRLPAGLLMLRVVR